MSFDIKEQIDLANKTAYAGMKAGYDIAGGEIEKLRTEKARLVAALRELTTGVNRLQTVTKADQQAVALPVCRALALLAELGEVS